MFLFFTFLKVFCLSKFYIHNFCEMIYHGVDNVSIVSRQHELLKCFIFSSIEINFY